MSLYHNLPPFFPHRQINNPTYQAQLRNTFIRRILRDYYTKFTTIPSLLIKYIFLCNITIEGQGFLHNLYVLHEMWVAPRRGRNSVLNPHTYVCLPLLSKYMINVLLISPDFVSTSIQQNMTSCGWVLSYIILITDCFKRFALQFSWKPISQNFN